MPLSDEDKVVKKNYTRLFFEFRFSLLAEISFRKFKIINFVCANFRKKYQAVYILFKIYVEVGEFFRVAQTFFTFSFLNILFDLKNNSLFTMASTETSNMSPSTR